MDVTAIIKDYRGREQRRETRCYAFVPEREAVLLPYPNPECEEVPAGGLTAEDLLGEVPENAHAGARLDLSVRHVAGHYPGRTVPAQATASFVREGNWVRVPMVSLPSPILSWKDGAVRNEMSYTGAVLNISPAARKYRAWGAQFGMAVASSPSAGDEPVSGADLAAVGGISYTIRNMVGDVALDFFVGWVQPVSGFREGYFAFRPGFTLGL